MGNILNTIFVYLFFIGIFSIIYMFTWGLVRNYFTRFALYYKLIIGGLFGILVVLAQGLIPYFVKDIDKNIATIYLPVLLGWIISVFISWISIILYLTIILLGNFVLIPATNIEFVQLLGTASILIYFALFIIAIIITIIGLYLKWTQWTMWSLITLISFILVSIVTLTTHQSDSFTNGLVEELNVLIWIAFSYLGYGIEWIIEMIYEHAIKLQNIIEYDRTTYIREALAHEAIYDLINRQKIQRGVYFTFEINNINKLDKIVSGNIKNKIIDVVARQVFNQWQNDDVLFFKASLNHFGIFLPFDKNLKVEINTLLENNRFKQRPTNDILKKFETLLQKVNTTFALHNYKISIKLQGYASIYGIQSNNLEKLKEYNITTADNRNNIEYENQVIFADIAEIREIKTQKRNILALNESANLEKIISLFYPVINVDDNYQVEFNYTSNLVNGSTLESFYDNDLKNVFLKTEQHILSRFNAALNIKNFKKLDDYLERKVFISYSANFIASEIFNLKKFATKLIELKIKPSNLILTFDLKEPSFNTKLFTKNLALIRKLGISIAVKNLGSDNTDVTSLYHYQSEFGLIAPEVIREMFIHLHNQELIKDLILLAKKLGINLVAPQVNSYLTYKKLNEFGINYMLGNLFGYFEEPQTIINNEVRYLLLKNLTKGDKNALKK